MTSDGLLGEGSFRSKMHEMMRASILEAARKRAAKVDWSAIRISDIADDVGVSRQTVYNEFGAKDDLARALFEAEIGTFVAGIVDITGRAPNITTALSDTLNWLFDAAGNHPIIQRMLSDARAGEGGSLLPILTVRPEVVLLPARQMLLKAFTDRWPARDIDRTEQMIDFVVRLSLSEILMPSDRPRVDVIEGIVTMSKAVLKPVNRGAAAARVVDSAS
ncbi:TetR family transcriptional regulator [Janibacter sp. G56]|uniref:TetR family transcriptional regulator n=1 Tax=Janibacter sp. G56 TaxID=3418717 RepID=UPI003D02EDE9